MNTREQNHEAYLLLRALSLFEQTQTDLPWAGPPLAQFSKTGALIAKSERLVAKRFRANLAESRALELIQLELELQAQLPPGNRIFMKRCWFAPFGDLRLSDDRRYGSYPILIMRRLPDGDELLSRVTRNTIPASFGASLGLVLRYFHNESPSRPTSVVGSSAKNESIVLESDIRSMEELLNVYSPPPEITRTLTLVMRRLLGFRSRAEKLLRERASRGFVRETHGDLHAENIYITEAGPLILDRQSNSRFRQVDIIRDVARIMVEFQRLDMHDAMTDFCQKYFGTVSDDEQFLLRYFVHRLILADGRRLARNNWNPETWRRGPFIVQHLRRALDEVI